MQKKNKKKYGVSPSMHYMTLVALLISTLSTLAVGISMSNMMGNSMGNLLVLGMQKKLAQAALYVDDGSSGTMVNAVRKGGGGGSGLQPVLEITVLDTIKSHYAEFGMNNATTTFGQFMVKAVNGDVDINSLSFSAIAPDNGTSGNKYLIEKVEVRDVTTMFPRTLASGTFPAGFFDTVATVASSTNPQIIQLRNNQTAKLEVGVKFIAMPSGGSGGGVALKLQGVDVRPNPDISGRASVAISGLGPKFASLYVFAGVPTVYAFDTVRPFSGGAFFQNVKLASVFVGEQSSQPIGIAEMVMKIEPSSPLPLDLAQLSMVATWPIPFAPWTATTTVATGQDFTVAADGKTVRIRFDVNSDDGSPHINPGQTERYLITAIRPENYVRFDLFRLMPPGSAANTFTTTLVKENAYLQSIVGAANVLDVERDLGGNSYFIWSDLNFPLNTSSTATNSYGWFNGYLLP